MAGTFSQRNNIPIEEQTVTVRNDAPEEFRLFLPEIYYSLGYGPAGLRPLVCRVLKKAPDADNWTEYPNIHQEIQWLLADCKWNKVYDVVEAIAAHLVGTPNNSRFHDELNEYFIENGIGWKLEDGLVQMRGDGEFEASVIEAVSALGDRAKDTSKTEIKEAILDLSRKPDADVTGAVQHSLAALECVVREITGNKNATLGKLINDNREIVPAPMDRVIAQMYGYASNTARHVEEGGEISFDEAELVTHLSASLCTYLAKKNFPTTANEEIKFPWE